MLGVSIDDFCRFPNKLQTHFLQHAFEFLLCETLVYLSKNFECQHLPLVKKFAQFV